MPSGGSITSRSCSRPAAGAGITANAGPGVIVTLKAVAVTGVVKQLANALATYRDVNWAVIRDACNRDIDAVKKREAVGFTWFTNAGNGFVGTPLVIQKVLPDLAPDIWGTPEDFFGSFGFFRDPDFPDRILPRGLGVTATTGRAIGPNGNLVGEIDYTRPDLYVVTLACGACHTGQAAGPNGRIVLEGAPNTQFDVRKWRQAFSTTRATRASWRSRSGRL